MARKKKPAIADTNEVLEYLTKVMRGETKESVIIMETPERSIRVAKVIKMPISEREKMKAAEMLAKGIGMLKESEIEKESQGLPQIIDDIGLTGNLLDLPDDENSSSEEQNLLGGLNEN